LRACSQIHAAPSAITLNSDDCPNPIRSDSFFHDAPTFRQSAIAHVANRTPASGSTRPFHRGGSHGDAHSRFCSRFSRISRHPSTVFTFNPSL